ncbi:MAG TPA: polysaccharide biosynthesis C-terminal domain-containing protein, partial [Balneolales bacterium]|nr:polysaccharide biosynthesis C-terminal domain-containing protein [Balneolales bacterium]
SIIFYFGIVIGYVNVLILLPYAFLPQQIGIIRILQSAAGLFTPLAQLGSTTIIHRYFHYFKHSEEEKYSFLRISFLIALTGFLLFCILIFLFREQIVQFYIAKSPLIIKYYYTLIPLTFFLVFLGILDALYMSNLRTIFIIFTKEVLLRILISFLLVLFVFQLLNFNNFVYLWVANYGLIIIILFVYLHKNKSFQINLKKLFNTKIGADLSSRRKEIVEFGFYSLLGTSGSLFIANIDTLMIGALLGAKDAGIYMTVYFIGLVINVPRRAIGRIVNPLIADASQKKDLKLIKYIYNRLSLNQLIIGLFLTIIIWINLDSLFQLMPNGQIYRAGKFVVLWIMIGKLIDMTAGVNSEILTYSQYYRFNILSIVFLSIMAIITNYIFIPIYGISGAAMATALSLLLNNIIKYIYIWVKLKMQPLDFNFVKAIIVGCISFFIIFTLPDLGHPILNILFRSAIFTFCYGSLILGSKASEDINSFVAKWYHQIRKYLQF